VREPRRAEVLPHALGDAFVLAEDDSQDEGATHAVRASAHRLLDPIAEAISEPREPSATPHLTPGTSAQDDVRSLPCEPRTLVEPSVRRPRLYNPDVGLQNRAARGRSADGQHEQRPLAEAQAAELPDLHESANRPRRPSSRGGHDELCRPGPPDLRREGGLVQGIEPEGSPPQAADGEREGDGGDAGPAVQEDEADHAREAERTQEQPAR
jgi:hypothetical protein